MASFRSLSSLFFFFSLASSSCFASLLNKSLLIIRRKSAAVLALIEPLSNSALTRAMASAAFEVLVCNSLPNDDRMLSANFLPLSAKSAVFLAASAIFLLKSSSSLPVNCNDFLTGSIEDKICANV